MGRKKTVFEELMAEKLRNIKTTNQQIRSSKEHNNIMLKYMTKFLKSSDKE